jgi:D-alanine-D-alanine ligase
VIPAPLDEGLTAQVQEISIATFRAEGCSGLARVDVFVDTADRSIRVSEVNTMPGFTDVSMYPKLWEASGVTYSRLVEELVHLAVDRKTALERRFWV